MENTVLRNDSVYRNYYSSIPFRLRYFPTDPSSELRGRTSMDLPKRGNRKIVGFRRRKKLTRLQKLPYNRYLDSVGKQDTNCSLATDDDDETQFLSIDTNLSQLETKAVFPFLY